jgi:hypothetical protein
MRTLSTTIGTAVLSLLLFYPAISLAGMTSTTDAKLFRLELELQPAQPVVGTNTAVLIITDAKSNQAVDEAKIEIVPWMTVHSHGSTKKPSIKKAGAGRYHVENIFYTMAGDWDLLVTIQKDDSRDTATFSIFNVKRK